jgi:LacI family transcriptional regulator
MLKGKKAAVRKGVQQRSAATSTPAALSAKAPGSKRPTINDIARLANVSKKTVSRVINQSPFVKQETREKINAMIQRAGYAPDPQARGLAFRRSFLLGLVYDNPNAQYIVNMQSGVLDALRGSGFELVVRPCDRKSKEFVTDVTSFVERQKLHGVILLPPISEDQTLARALQEIDCRYVRIASVRVDDAEHMVLSNDREAMADVVNYLVSLGHKRIALITGPASYRSTHERRLGFTSALQKRGLTLPDDLIMEGAYSYESGVMCGEALLTRRNRPTAIFASNDEMAAGVYKAAARLGISIPQDLSVVGFDDTPIAARLEPSLTTVRLPIREMGQLAASKLLPPRGGEDGERNALAVMVPHLVERESAAPPRSAPD